MSRTIRLLFLFLVAISGLASTSEQKRIAITIDDVPFSAATPITTEEASALNRALLNTLKRHKVRAVGFFNEDRLLVSGKVDAGIAILPAASQAILPSVVGVVRLKPRSAPRE